MIDAGLPMPDVRAVLDSAAPHIDVWKFGWGSAYLDAALDAKLSLLRRHDVIACPGGTLLELAALQGRAAECLEWAAACGFTQVEVSDGLGLLGEDAKTALIRRAAAQILRHAKLDPPLPDDELIAANILAGGLAVERDKEAGSSNQIGSGIVNLSLTNANPQPSLPDWPQAQEEIELQVQEAIEGNVTPAEAAANMRSALEEILG